MINKLKKQFIMWHMGINTLIVLACFFVIYIITQSSIETRNNERLSLLNANTLSTDYIIYFSVTLNENNELIATRSPITLQPSTISQAMKIYVDNGNENTNISFSGKHWLYSTTYNNNSNTKEVIFLDTTESYYLLQNLLIIFFIVGVTVIIINFFISLLFANRFIRPISQSFQKQKQFVADASHELKTPLAIISTNTEALMSENNSPTQNTWANNILTQIERMELLVKNLLFLAKADETSTITKLIPINLTQLLEEVLTELEAKIFEKNINLQTQIRPNTIINSDAFHTKQVLIILLDNAIKYTDEKGEIFVGLEKEKSRTRIIIRNSSKGISPQHLPHIFDRFYRADESRSSDGSFGLGLPIAKTIMEKIGGSLFVESKENESVTFTISF